MERETESMLADYHIHTSFSGDSEYEMEDVVLRAIELGLHEICFTEHVDYFQSCESHLINYGAYFSKIGRLKAKYGDRIVLKAGAEFGVQRNTIPEFERDFSEYGFDFIILSNHQVDDTEFWNGDYQKGRSQKQYNKDYYQAILEVISAFDSYSVLGHLDMIKRYDPAGILEDFANEELIKAILETAVKNGKGLEVNTSCFRYGLADLTPSKTILDWYRRLGGRILTLGSDSHRESHLGCRLSYVKEELKKLGFKEFCTFTGMMPECHDL